MLLSLFTAITSAGTMYTCNCRCTRTGSEVLHRIIADPGRYFLTLNYTWHTGNGSDFSELTGLNPIDPTVVHTLGIKLGDSPVECLGVPTVSC
jgi:hypothetical protein